MAISLSSQRVNMLPPLKRQRRSATAVLSGDFDVRPARDVLTSLLNGIGPYKAVEKDEETRRHRRKEKKERERERRRAKAAAKVREKALGEGSQGAAHAAIPAHIPVPHPTNSATSSFWRARARPAIHIPAMQRSVSVTPPPMVSSPPPMLSSPASTPGPSSSSSTSRNSSKRPRTPYDDEDLDHPHGMGNPMDQPARKKRVAVKKGWKGWVEGSPPPSEKLINLDAVPVLQERRTRSGKNFDAIGVGKESWV